MATPASHSEAQGACQKQHSGGNLASFVSEDNINSMIESIEQIPGSERLYFWTGLKYTQANDTWSFIDGANTTLAVSIVRRLPTNSSCVSIRGDGNLSVTLCGESKPFICQVVQDRTDPSGATLTGSRNFFYT